MQVELCEIPSAGAPEVLGSETYLGVRCNDEGRGERRRWAFFRILLAFEYHRVGRRAIFFRGSMKPLWGAGFAFCRLDEESAQETLDLLREIADEDKAIYPEKIVPKGQHDCI